MIISAKCAIDKVGGDAGGCKWFVPERQKGGFINRSQNKDTKQQQWERWKRGQRIRLNRENQINSIILKFIQSYEESRYKD